MSEVRLSGRRDLGSRGFPTEDEVNDVSPQKTLSLTRPGSRGAGPRVPGSSTLEVVQRGRRRGPDRCVVPRQGAEGVIWESGRPALQK